MRTVGLQWVEYRAAWSSSKDEDIGTVEDLRGQLKELIEVERERQFEGELPEQAPAPLLKRKTFKELGTPTMQARMNHSFAHSLMSHSFIISFTHSSAGG